MKKLFLSGVLFFIVSYSFAQKDFQWDVIDTISKTKSEIYTDTKLFIAETWNSAQSVIQNDDKEGGVILVKGITKVSTFFQLNPHDYTYKYTVKFFQKEGRFKIVLDEVHCTSALCQMNEWPKVEPTEDYSKKVGGVPTKRLEPMMIELKANLQAIVDAYLIKIKNPSVKANDW